MKTRLFSLLLALLCTTMSSAHHSASAIFDTSDIVEMEATLTEVNWRNPHIRLSLDPIDKTEFTEAWIFESQPPQWYRRVGVSRKQFQNAIGESVKVTGMKARNGEPFGLLLSMTFPDGTSFQMVNDQGENQE